MNIKYQTDFYAGQENKFVSIKLKCVCLAIDIVTITTKMFSSISVQFEFVARKITTWEHQSDLFIVEWLMKIASTIDRKRRVNIFILKYTLMRWCMSSSEFGSISDKTHFVRVRSLRARCFSLSLDMNWIEWTVVWMCVQVNWPNRNCNVQQNTVYR